MSILMPLMLSMEQIQLGSDREQEDSRIPTASWTIRPRSSVINALGDSQVPAEIKESSLISLSPPCGCVKRVEGQPA